MFYLNDVYPLLDLPLRELYPLARLDDATGYHPLGEHALLMLVALTGTGKTTTLTALQELMGSGGMNVIPSRRQVADWIAIPMMQFVAGEALAPVANRVERFRYTKLFSEKVPGGMAAAFSWLRVADTYKGLVISEGIRGAVEIRHALRSFPGWEIVELSLDPLTRLRRLSERRQAFDQAAGEADVSFLPPAIREQARALLASDEITEKALKIMGAEAENYGLYAYAAGDAVANYHCVPVDKLSPQEVAHCLREILEVIINDNN